MNKLPIDSQSCISSDSSTGIRSAKDDGCNRIVLIKDDYAVLMMNVIKYLDNTDISSSEFEL